MAAGVVVVTNANPWIISYTASAAAGFTLPYQLWPTLGYAGPTSPCIVQRWVWLGNGAGSKTTSAGDEVILTDLEGNNFLELIATGADFEPPQEWKRQRNEGVPYGAIITRFDSGVLYGYL